MTVGQGDPTADPVAGVNAAAHNSDLARRIQMLQDGGHTWMDPQTQVALAGSPMPDHSLTSAGDAIRGLLNNVQQSFSTVFDDPVLHKTPSTSMKVAQWVGDNVGYLPVEQTDVTNIQKQLQAKGFGTGLPTDGVWNAAYNQAYQDAWYAHVQDQQDNQGQIAPVHKVAHGFLSSLGLSHAIPALIGSIKSIPGDVRSLAADTAGGVRSQVQQLIGGVNAASNPGHSTGLTETPQQAGARVAASVENIGNQGKQVTAQDILAHPYARMVNDIGTMLMFVPYGKVGTELARTLGTDVLKDTGRAAFRALPADVAYRGPGVVAKSFVTTGDEAGFNGLGRLMDNTPGLRQLYPVVRKVGFTENSYYYTTRRALAQPMRNPLINLGARTAQYTSLLGAANRGIAAAEGEAGDKTHGIAAGVYGQGTMTGHWGAVLDLAGSLGKATLGSDPSKAVGDIVKGAERLTTTALGGPVDVGTSFDKAMQAAGKHGLITGLTSKDMSYNTLTSKFGKGAVDDYLNDQLNHFAAAKVAEAGLQRDFVNTGIALTGTDRTAAFLALQHSAWNTPDLLAQARDELVQNPPALLEAFLRQHNGIAQDLSSSAGSGPGIGGYLQAKSAAYRLFKGWSDSLVTPEAYEGLATARQTAADDAEFNGGGAPWFSQGHPQLYQGSAAPTAEEALNDTQPDRYGSGLVSSNVKSRADAADHTYYLQHTGGGPAGSALYHGSHNPLPGTLGNGESVGNMFGPGFYATDSHAIASDYAGGNHVYHVSLKSGQVPRSLNLDEKAPDFLRRAVEDLRAQVAAHGAEADSPSKYAGNQLREALANEDSTGADLVRMYRLYVKSAVLPSSSNGPNLKNAFVEKLSQIIGHRYDVMHSASDPGARTAAVSGVEHRTHVFLHPENVQADRVTSPVTSGSKKPQFADLNQPATQDLLKAIRSSLTSKEGRAAHAASTSIAASPQEYQTLRHLMTDKFATGKQVLDAYRKSLENAGALSKDEVQAQIEAVSAKAHANLTGYRYRGKQGAWQHVITNPDGVQAVEKAQPAPIAPTQDFVQGLGLTPAPGRLGLARQDTLLAEDHRRAATEFAARLDRLGLKSEVDSELADLDLDPLGKNMMLHDTPPVKPEDRSAGLDQITKEMVAYLRNEMSLDPHEIRVNYPAKLMATIAKGAKTAATEVHLPIDADPELSAAYQAVKDLGYKVTWGTDIGHFFTDPVIDPAVISGHQSMLRKFVGAMGLSIDHFPTSTPGMYARQTAIADLQRLSDSGRLKMAPGETPAMLLARVSNTTRQPTGPERIAFGAAANIIHRTAADMMVARGEAENREHAFGQMLQAIVNHEGISNLSLKQFTRAVQDTPAELADFYKAMGLADDQPMYSAADAALIYRTVLNAQAKRPASMMGLSKLEDVFRAAPSLAMSKLQMDRVQVPGLAQVLRRASVLPNDLIRVRNKYKFSYSPMFDLRRAAKTSFKMGLEGIPHTISPLKSMLTRGTFDNDTALLNRVMPEDALRGQGFDDMDRYLNTQSIFGFNVRHYMAYAAGELNRQGLGDDEIRAKILHMFTYGDRTALERTMSTLWYPFSFEKTLYRNLGGYLLDHPTQRVMLEWSLNAYHALDKQVGIQDWLDKHLPVAKELEKVNAFADGVGLGQFGGINRPLFNMLLPQQNNNPLPVNVLQAAVPAYNDLNYLLVGYDPKSGTVKNGGAVQNTFWNAFNYYQEAVADKSSLLRQHHPAETPKAQQEDGYKFRMSLIAKAAPTLDWNYHHPNNPLVFPSDIPGLPEPLRGQKITRSAIGQLTKLWYPDFDPNAAQASSIEKAQALKDDLSRMAVAEPDRAQQYAAFTKLADQIKGHVLHDDYEIPQLSDLTSRMRTYVTNLSEQDPRFYKFYNTYYRSTFGPLENLQ